MIHLILVGYQISREGSGQLECYKAVVQGPALSTPACDFTEHI